MYADFPALREAHAYLRHKNYSSALQIYVEILGTLSEDSEEYSMILLEYCQCLLENIMQQSEMNYRKILQTRNPVDEEEIEDDLENCWECLETCRIHFETMQDRGRLAMVHKGLGDVHCLQNGFDEGRNEYIAALEYSEDDSQRMEIYECIAECYRNMKIYDDAIHYYGEAAKASERMGMHEEALEFRGLMEGIKMLQEYGNEEESSTAESEGGKPMDVNHLKK